MSLTPFRAPRRRTAFYALGYALGALLALLPLALELALILIWMGCCLLFLVAVFA
jgi:hypothetical protein